MRRSLTRPCRGCRVRRRGAPRRSGPPPPRAGGGRGGVAAAIAATSRQVGVALGVAIAGSVLASGIHGPLQADFIQAGRAGWWITAGYGAAVLVLGLLTTGRWARRTAERAAASLALE